MPKLVSDENLQQYGTAVKTYVDEKTSEENENVVAMTEDEVDDMLEDIGFIASETT